MRRPPPGWPGSARNSLRTHRVSAWAVLRRQLNNAVLALLALTAVVSVFLGDRTQALIIGIILVVSVGLGFVNEYRAEQASAALHSRVRHNAVVRRDGRNCKIDVNQLVPGDVIELTSANWCPPTSGCSASTHWNATRASSPASPSRW